MNGYAFISYRSGDSRAYVDQLAEFLTSSGVAVWYDRDVVTGDRWERVIKAKVDGCSALVVVMTPGAEESDWVNREITEAEHLGRPILPLLLTGNRFFRLSNLQFEDVRDGRMPSRRFVDQLRKLVGSAGADRTDDGRDMVISLARRHQVVVHHLLDALSAIEYREPDAVRRARLAEVKAAAERLRRNDERLLIVANDDSVRRTGHQNAKLESILVQQAETRKPRRIELSHVDRDIVIVEGAVYDIGVVVGELLDNAIAFSDARLATKDRRSPDRTPRAPRGNRAREAVLGMSSTQRPRLGRETTRSRRIWRFECRP